MGTEQIEYFTNNSYIIQVLSSNCKSTALWEVFVKRNK